VNRRLITGVAVLTVTSMLASTTGATSSSGARSGMAADPEGRLIGLFADLDASLANVRQDPYLSAVLDRSGAAPELSIDQAIEIIESLDSDQRELVDEVLDATPALAAIPDAIDAAVAEAEQFTPDAVPGQTQVNGLRSGLAAGRRAAAASSFAPFALAPAVQSATYTDDCPSAGDPSALVIAVLVLNQLQSAAYAAVIAMPGVIAAVGFSIPNPVKWALAIYYGISLAVYLALAQTLAVASDCAAAAGSEELTLAWPVAGPGSVDPPPGSPVPGSSQITVDAALATIGDVTALLNSVNTNVTLVNGQVVSLGDQAVQLNTILSCTSGIPAAVPGVTCGSDPGQPPPGSDALSAATTAQGDIQTTQADVAILRNTQHTVLDKANQQIDALGALRDLQIRMEIEANLSDPAFQAVGLFQLPAPNGYLDVVADVATEAVQRFVGGERELQAANAAAAGGRYKEAYELYHKAYQGALR
jgi:hypothetical protein